MRKAYFIFLGPHSRTQGFYTSLSPKSKSCWETNGQSLFAQTTSYRAVLDQERNLANLWKGFRQKRPVASSVFFPLSAILSWQSRWKEAEADPCLGGQEPGGEDVLHQLSSLPFCHLTPCILKKEEEEGLARVEKGSGIFPWAKRYCFSFGAREFGGVEKATGLFLECKSTMSQLYSLSLS